MPEAMQANGFAPDDGDGRNKFPVISGKIQPRAFQIKQAADLLDISPQWCHTLINRKLLDTRIIAGRRHVIANARLERMRKERQERGK